MVFSGPEDAHTEILLDLLQKPRILRRFLEEVLRIPTGGLTAEDGVEIRTQVANQDARGVPDLHIRRDPHLFVLVENKLKAGFTDNQPGEYMKELRIWKTEHPHGVAALVVQAPEGRLDTLLQHAWGRLAREGCKDRQGENEGVLLRFVSWQETAKSLSDIDLEEDPATAFIRDGLLDLIPTTERMSSIPLTKEIVSVLTDQASLSALTAMGDALRDVASELKERGEVVGKTSIASDFTYWGFYTQEDVAGIGRMWIGAFPRAGVRFGRGPLWMQVSGETPVGDGWEQRFELAGIVAHDPSEFPGWGGTLVALDLEPDKLPEEQARQLADEIQRVRKIATGE